jgi:hypothetical protein
MNAAARVAGGTPRGRRACAGITGVPRAMPAEPLAGLAGGGAGVTGGDRAVRLIPREPLQRPPQTVRSPRSSLKRLAHAAGRSLGSGSRRP